jgi:endonuclease G
LESYCRKLAREGNELYIITGNYGVGGTSTKGYREKLAGGKITVPRNLWKIIVVLPKGDNDLSRIDANTRVIAVDMPNKDSIGDDNWADYRVSVNEIEALTGYDLLSKLSKSLQTVLEARVDAEEIP